MTISPEVLGAMVCPTCQSDVFMSDLDVRCANGHVMHVSNGIIDAGQAVVDEETERTFASFGYEWTAFGDVTAEELRFWDRYFKDVPVEALAGSLAADIGCGKGRYSRVTASRVAHLVALDGSDAVHSAARNMADLDNVVVVRADLNHAPLRPGAFDFVSCLGVLHHLGDPRRGFEKVSSLVGVDGWLLLYLYSRDEAKSLRSAGLAVANRLRRLSVRMPHRALRILCYPFALVLYASLVLPGALGEAAHVSPLSRLPLNGYRRQRLRVLWLDTFDRMSAPIETRYTLSEVAGWFADAGLDIVSVDEEYGLMIVARRPGR
jgi:SAM-dependent methyltransferase